MDITLGERISTLRRQKEMTQETQKLEAGRSKQRGRRTYRNQAVNSVPFKCFIIQKRNII